MQNITVHIQTITPLLQIEGNTKLNGMDYITIKETSMLVYGEIIKVPIYTANGFRGLLRRKAAEILAQKAIEKGIKISTTDFHLMFAGGGNNFQSQKFAVEQKVRELNPLISLFGTSLAVEGKLMVTDFVPDRNLIEEKARIKDNTFFIKKDDVLDKTKFSRFLKKDDIEAWEAAVLENQTQRKKDREIEKDSSDKVKKQSIKHIQGRFYVIPGVEFQSSIGFKQDLNLIEYGLLIRALKEITKEQLGSTQNLGFGVCKWDIVFVDNQGVEVGSEIITIPSNENLFVRDIAETLLDKEEKAVKEFDKWLENIEEQNIVISEILE